MWKRALKAGLSIGVGWAVAAAFPDVELWVPVSIAIGCLVILIAGDFWGTELLTWLKGGRQPINHAYEYLKDIGIYQGEDNEAIGIAALLRQAAYDGDITVWGSSPTFAQFGEPFLAILPSEYWKDYEIEPGCLMVSADELTEKGHVTEFNLFGQSNRLAEPEIYWHLHVDMREVSGKWQRGLTRRKN